MNAFIDSIGLSTFIAIDLGTTGLNPKHDKIIEISAVKFHQCKPMGWDTPARHDPPWQSTHQRLSR